MLRLGLGSVGGRGGGTGKEMVTERAVATNVEVRVGACRFGMGGGAEFFVAQCEVGLRGALFASACICLQIKKNYNTWSRKLLLSSLSTCPVQALFMTA
jgi:hypothetical protein